MGKTFKTGKSKTKKTETKKTKLKNDEDRKFKKFRRLDEE